MLMTKLPWASHFPTLPAMHASSSPEQGDEKFRVAKRLLYPSAWARFELKISGETVPVAGGIDEMIVGMCVTVLAGTRNGEVGEGLEMLAGGVALNVATVEKLITMTVVEFPPDSDWKPAETAKVEDEGPTFGVATGLVLLSGK